MTITWRPMEPPEWFPRSYYIEQQVERVLHPLTLGRSREELEWTTRRHAANRWEEMWRET